MSGGSVVPFLIHAGAARGRVVRLTEAVATILAGHEADPPVVRQTLAEMLAIATILASSLKYEGVFTLQIQSDGPISFAVVDITHDGALRGYARYDADKITALAEIAQPNVNQLFGQGILAFTIDQLNVDDRYQGIVGLAGESLTHCVESYFRMSEQIDTALLVAARLEPQPHAAALMVQRMPLEGHSPIQTTEQRDDDWRRAMVLLRSTRPEEVFDLSLSSEALLYRLYHDDGLVCYEPRPIRAECRCSDDKIRRALQSVPRHELEAIRQEAGVVEVVCEFCRTARRFDDLDALYGI